MTSELNHILMAACLLIVAGIASFPYRLSYGNTAWLPRKMRPDRAYLERPYEYDYPAHNINLLFSVSVALIGTLALIFILAPDLPDDVPAERWFSALAVLYPAYASCQVLFWRKDYGDGFCYADRLTAFSYGKSDTILLTAAALFTLHLTGVLPLSVYRIAAAVFSALCCQFLIHDYIHVFRLRGNNEYSDPIGLKEMYPESLNLLSFPPLAALSVVSLWRDPPLFAMFFGILLLCLTAIRYICRFHPAIRGDEHERRGCLRYWRRNRKVENEQLKTMI